MIISEICPGVYILLVALQGQLVPRGEHSTLKKEPEKELYFVSETVFRKWRMSWRLTECSSSILMSELE